MRTILFVLVVTAVLWWLVRPRRRTRRRAAWSEPQPTYKAVKTFRTPGGVATTVWEAEWRNGGPVQRWHSWTCDCDREEQGYEALRYAVSAAIAHHEAHGR